MTRSTLILIAMMFGSCTAEALEPAVDGIPKTPASAEALALVRAKDPGDARTVLEARKAGAADAVTVLGRIRASAKGYLAFTIIDGGVDYCGEACKADCMTPWDYCCEDAERITSASIAVEARGSDGKPIKTPALPGLRLLDAVKVTGKLEKDERGNYTLLASDIWRADRPKLPGGLSWPQ